MVIPVVVPDGHVALVECWGKYDRTLKPGLNFIIPFAEECKDVRPWGKVANKNGWKIEMTEQQTTTPVRTFQTLDNEIQASVSVTWLITDPVKAVYQVDVLPNSINDAALNALRSNIGNHSLDEVVTLRGKLNETIAGELVERTHRWGVKLLGVEIQEFKCSEATTQARMKQMMAEKDKEAAIIRAAGEADAELRKAEGHAQALRILAEADRKYLEELMKKLPDWQAADILRAQKQGENMKVISQNPANKVFLPAGGVNITTQG